MEKKVVTVHGKKYYLLGVNKQGEHVYLMEASWDCDWYWGLGYVRTFTNDRCPQLSRDIRMHDHFDSMFLKKDLHDSFLEYFTDTVLTDDEIWALLELMKSLYKLKEYSDFLHLGGAYVTKNPCENEIRNDEEYKRINQFVIPLLNNKVYELLGERS